MAAGALWALDHHVERLAMDHDNARTLARGLADIPGITIDPHEVATNIVIFQVADAHALCTQLSLGSNQRGEKAAHTRFPIVIGYTSRPSAEEKPGRDTEHG